ncbi:hypothetical protein ACIPVK_02495 [Paeniglutamicibacter sp. MACA_103]|uniref:hypothetical protein n=1 Tax=Paeniglutamicibacter sp. MACA_103 TaxID=3377337 RepID=UPI003892E262
MASNTRPEAPDAARPLLHWVGATVVAMACTLTGWYLPLPFRLAGLPFAVAGFVLGLLTSLKAFGNPAAGVLKLAAPVATAACGLVALLLAGQLVFLGPALQYQQCLEDALTLRSEAACTQDFTDRLNPGE